MEKTAKVTKLTKFDKLDNYGNTSFSVEFSNGDKGFYSTKKADQTNFVVDKEATYVIEEKEGKEGKRYFKIKLPDTGNSFQGGGAFKAKAPANNASFCLAYSKDIFIAKLQSLGGKEVKEDEIFSLADKMYNWMEAHK